MAYLLRGSRDISDILLLRPRFTKMTLHCKRLSLTMIINQILIWFHLLKTFKALNDIPIPILHDPTANRVINLKSQLFYD
jgi:hypothetical protein